MATQQEVIYNFMQSLDNTTLKGGAAVNEAIRASSNFKNFAAVKKQFMNDLRSAKNWQTFLIEKCGIILTNDDTGAISGSDAGGSKVKGKYDILPSKGKAKYPSGTSFTVDGLTIYGIPPKKSLTADQQYVVKGLYSWWIPDALKLIKESYGFSFDETDTTSSRLKLEFIDDESNGFLAAVGFGSEDGETFESQTLTVNMAFFKDMDSDDRHGQTVGQGDLDRVLAHEFVHGTMASNILYFGYLPGFLLEGGSAELIHGIDDERTFDIIEYAQNPDILDKVLVNKSVTTGIPLEAYAGGYMFMRYFAKQAGTDTTFDYDTYRKTVSVNDNFAINYHDKVTMKGGSGNDNIVNSGAKVSINAGAGDDAVNNYYDKVTILGGKGNDALSNTGSKVSIDGGKGNDTLNSGGSNVSIDCGKGNDLVSSAGSKVTLIGGAGKDTLMNTEGNSVIFIGGSGNDNLLNDIDGFTSKGFTKSKKISDGEEPSNGAWIVSSDGKMYSVKFTGGKNVSMLGGEGKDTITNDGGTNATIYGDAGNDKITNYGYAAQIYGGDGNDNITNSVFTRSSGNDTLFTSGYKSQIYGGAGKDKITNEADSVIIFGEDDSDTIANSGDNVLIDGGIGDDYVENEGNTCAISLGSGNDTASNVATEVFIDGGTGNDSISNNGEEVTLSGGYGKDTIANYGSKALIYGMSGNDSIYSAGIEVTIEGGEGKDTIINEGVKVYLVGGAGNDSISNYGNHITIAGSGGNDYIVNFNDDDNEGGKDITYEFGAGDGKDTVVGFNDGDTIQITSGSYKTSKSGSDVVVKVGSSTLTLKDAAGKNINFISESGETYSKMYTTAKVAQLWFAEENNFATSDNLSSLVESKSYSVAELNYSSDLTSGANKNNFITYSGTKS
ncbi:MAG: calcium-binding protein [Selenomonadaceae bacterium]|nr:calcium-binding protein [Selenomonadaceae bacterium]